MDSSLFEPVITPVLSAVGVYTHFHFTRYQASLDQVQAVSRTMEDVMTNTAGLFSRNRPARAQA